MRQERFLFLRVLHSESWYISVKKILPVVVIDNNTFSSVSSIFKDDCSSIPHYHLCVTKKMKFLVDDAQQVTFGWSAKSGCTFMKGFFYYLVTGKDPSLHHDLSTIHNDPCVLAHHLTEAPPPEYTTFLLCRDPFDRFLSGFLDKYVDNPYFQDLWTKRYPTTLLSFQEFVRHFHELMDDPHHSHHFGRQFTLPLTYFTGHLELIPLLPNMSSSLASILKQYNHIGSIPPSVLSFGRPTVPHHKLESIPRFLYERLNVHQLTVGTYAHYQLPRAVLPYFWTPYLRSLVSLYFQNDIEIFSRCMRRQPTEIPEEREQERGRIEEEEVLSSYHHDAHEQNKEKEEDKDDPPTIVGTVGLPAPPWIIYTCKRYLPRAEYLYHLLLQCTTWRTGKVWIAYGEPSLSAAQRQEDKYILLPCPDGYDGLCRKTQALLQTGWFDMSGLIKCDDDIVPHIPELEQWWRQCCCNPEIGYAGRRSSFRKSPSANPMPYAAGPLYYLSGPCVMEIRNRLDTSIYYEDVMVGMAVQTTDHLVVFNSPQPYYNGFSLHQTMEDRKARFLSIRIHGGLGNMLFQAASAAGMAYQSQRYLVLQYDDQSVVPHMSSTDVLSSIFGRFRLSRAPLPDLPGRIQYQEPRESYAQHRPPSSAILHHPSFHVSLSGYFQNEKYFRPIESWIRSQFRWLVTLHNPSERFFIHVRRGDYVHHPYYYYDMSEYYRQCIAYLGKDQPYLVVSNDIQWCRQQPYFLECPNLEFCSSSNDDDGILYSFGSILSCTLGGIGANSTFSWWASYLTPSPTKQVILPARWLRFSPAASDIHFRGCIMAIQNQDGSWTFSRKQ